MGMTVGDLLDALAHLATTAGRGTLIYTGCPGECLHPVRGLTLEAGLGDSEDDAVVLEGDDDEEEAVER